MSAATAQLELNRMRSDLAAWLEVREYNDAVAAGKFTAKHPVDQAAKNVAALRNGAREAVLAERLRRLLIEVHGTSLGLKLDAPALARIVISGQLPNAAATPQGIFWLPFIGIGVGAMLILSLVRTLAQKAKDDEERIACINSGGDSPYCPTPWGKYALIGGIAYLVLAKTNLVNRVLGR